MLSAPRVSIHILNYNGGDDILICLRSLCQLTYENLRILVIDNASADDSLARIQAEFPSIDIIRNTVNLGFGGGHNVGIRDALDRRIPYIWLLNQDAAVAADALSQLIETAEANPSIGAMSPRVLNPDDTVWFEGGQINWWRMRAVHTPTQPGRDPEYLSGCALFLRSSILSPTGLFDEDFFLYYEDADISRRIQRAGFRLLVEPKARVWHTEASNHNNPHKTLWLVWSGLLFFQKQTPWYFRCWTQLYILFRVGYNYFLCQLHPTPLRRALIRCYFTFFRRYGFFAFLLHPRQLPKRGAHPPVADFLARPRH